MTSLQFLEAQHDLWYLGWHGLIELGFPKPNPMFTEYQREITRFIRPGPNSPGKWRCPVCNKARGRSWFWTQLVPFAASLPLNSFTSFSIEYTPHFFPALTPVCTHHILKQWPPDSLELIYSGHWIGIGPRNS